MGSPSGHGPLQQVVAQVWSGLEQAAQRRDHPWRTATLASADANGSPDARIMVLREADAGTQTLLFYTDARSPKVGALLRRPDGLLLFWDAQRQWQLRVRCAISVITEGPEVTRRWQQVGRSRTAGDYLSALAPGERLAQPGVTAAPSPHTRDGTHNGTHHFAVLRAVAHEIDWLALSRDGHHRALIRGAEITPLQP